MAKCSNSGENSKESTCKGSDSGMSSNGGKISKSGNSSKCSNSG